MSGQPTDDNKFIMIINGQLYKVSGNITIPVLKEESISTPSPKLRWRNFPIFLIKPLIQVASFGEGKYATYDFLKKEYTVNDHMDALKRHMEEFENPNVPDTDHESGLLHPFHMAWRALMVGYVMQFHPKRDDRYKMEQK